VPHTGQRRKDRHDRGAGVGGTFLTTAERALLPHGARILTMLMGMRFLTDHLEGDVYYRTARPGHNLDRSRTQIALIRSMDARRDEIAAVTEAAFEGFTG
jgi:hypothetical protein